MLLFFCFFVLFVDVVVVVGFFVFVLIAIEIVCIIEEKTPTVL